MLSLGNVFNESEIVKFDERIEKESQLSKVFIDINNLTNKFNEEKNMYVN